MPRQTIEVTTIASAMKSSQKRACRLEYYLEVVLTNNLSRVFYDVTSRNVVYRRRVLYRCVPVNVCHRGGEGRLLAWTELQRYDQMSRHSQGQGRNRVGHQGPEQRPGSV